MLFSSTTFLYLFLPTVLFFYYVVLRGRRHWQNVFLLLASLLFYAWGEPRFVLVMAGAIVANWFFGFMISQKRGDAGFCKLLLALDVVFNLAILFVFKYLAFACNLINGAFGLHLPIPEAALPIGISFFTFQAMSYVVDVYRGKGETQTNLLYVGLYISFFPQLVAGPIVRYRTIADQITNRTESLGDLFEGFSRFVIGLAKKVLLANSLALLADQAFGAVRDGASISVLFGWLGALAYTLQIFFDFSGYSDMAIGLGRMFGFRFLENFNYPYVSTSITEFWRRWHISLGSWFRDYLYIPLGGSRRGRGRTVFNLLTVWLLTGLWHGASFNFLLWGLWFFVLLVLEKSFSPGRGVLAIHNKITILQGSFSPGRGVLGWLYTFFFVMLGFVLFRSETLEAAWSYFGCMFGLRGNAFSDGFFVGWFTQKMVLLGIGLLLCTPLLRRLGEKMKDRPVLGYVRAIGLFCLFVLSVASLVSGSHNPFIYFQF